MKTLLHGPHGEPNMVQEGGADMCQHCGIGTGAILKCGACHVQGHAACIPFRDGKCHACAYGIDPCTPACVLCRRPDERGLDSRSRCRLPLAVLGYGRTFSAQPARDEAAWVAAGHARVASPEVRRVLDADPTGPLPAALMTATKTYYPKEPLLHLAAEPLVVHTWCAAVHTNLDVSHEDCKEAVCFLLDRQAAAIKSRIVCALCDEGEGLLLQCTDHKGALQHIHPSCGVKRGMQRLNCSSGRAGMCAYGQYGIGGNAVQPSGFRRDLPKTRALAYKRQATCEAPAPPPPAAAKQAAAPSGQRAKRPAQEVAGEARETADANRADDRAKDVDTLMDGLRNMGQSRAKLQKENWHLRKRVGALEARVAELEPRVAGAVTATAMEDMITALLAQSHQKMFDELREQLAQSHQKMFDELREQQAREQQARG